MVPSCHWHIEIFDNAFNVALLLQQQIRQEQLSSALSLHFQQPVKRAEELFRGRKFFDFLAKISQGMRVLTDRLRHLVQPKCE